MFENLFSEKQKEPTAWSILGQILLGIGKALVMVGGIIFLGLGFYSLNQLYPIF